MLGVGGFRRWIGNGGLLGFDGAGFEVFEAALAF